MLCHNTNNLFYRPTKICIILLGIKIIWVYGNNYNHFPRLIIALFNSSWTSNSISRRQDNSAHSPKGFKLSLNSTKTNHPYIYLTPTESEEGKLP